MIETRRLELLIGKVVKFFYTIGGVRHNAVGMLYGFDDDRVVLDRSLNDWLHIDRKTISLVMAYTDYVFVYQHKFTGVFTSQVETLMEEVSYREGDKLRFANGQLLITARGKQTPNRVKKLHSVYSPSEIRVVYMP